MEQEQTSSQGKIKKGVAYLLATESSPEKNLRFAMMHPSRVHGIVTVNNTATESLGRFTDRLKVQQLLYIH